MLTELYETKDKLAKTEAELLEMNKKFSSEIAHLADQMKALQEKIETDSAEAAKTHEDKKGHGKDPAFFSPVP